MSSDIATDRSHYLNLTKRMVARVTLVISQQGRKHLKEMSGIYVASTPPLNNIWKKK